MRWRIVRSAALLLAGSLSCGGDDESRPVPPVVPTDGGAAGCQPGHATQPDGGCIAAGIPADQCAPGFTADDHGGCTPTLPAPCQKGSMAVPGESACREVAPCGTTTWGEIPIEATTEFVDAAYRGGMSDGSEARPWTTIQAGIGAAAPGAIVAVAAGNYAEDVSITSKPVRLWGRCPSRVTVAGTGSEFATFQIFGAASSESELHDLAVTSDTRGIALSGTSGIVMDRIWVHDVARRGIVLQGDVGAAEVTLHRSLVEGARDEGVFVSRSRIMIDASVVRGIVPGAALGYATGISIQAGPSHGERSTGTVTGSVIELVTGIGMTVIGADTTMDAVVIRNGASGTDGHYGRALTVQYDPTTQERANVTLARSTLVDNRDHAVLVSGSSLKVTTTVMARTAPDAAGLFGRGISVQADHEDGVGADLDLAQSVIEENHEAGVFFSGAEGVVTSTIVRATTAAPDGFGRGIEIDYDQASDRRSKVTVQNSLVEQSQEVGIATLRSDATVAMTLVREVSPRGDGAFGDGLVVASNDATASLDIRASRVEGATRAGISSFGADVTVGATQFECNPIDLDGEPLGDTPYSFQDLGQNVCGCGSEPRSCKVQSANLTPPPPLADDGP